MATHIKLETLNLTELNLLLAHLRLGSGHLETQVNSRQLSNLLNSGSLTYQQLLSVSSNKKEKSGNVALVLNTVITSIFGAWMGFYGFMGLHLDSYAVLYGVTSIAVFTSFIVSFFSFRLTTKREKSALHKQRIYNLQSNVLNLIISKEKESLDSLAKYLNNSLNYLIEKSFVFSAPIKIQSDKNIFDFNEKEDCAIWLAKIKETILFKADIICEEEIFKFYSDRLLRILEKIRESIELNYLVISSGKIKNSHLLASSDPLLSLFSSAPDKPESSLNHSNWVRQNFLDLLAGLFPTILGGFASMFVFLAGGPNLAKELGLLHLEQILRYSNSRLIEFTIAICLTLYFGVSFVYNNYKNYIREQESARTKRLLSRLEKEDIFLKRKMSILTKLKNYSKRIINIYTAIENINQNIAHINSK